MRVNLLSINLCTNLPLRWQIEHKSHLNTVRTPQIYNSPPPPPNFWAERYPTHTHHSPALKGLTPKGPQVLYKSTVCRVSSAFLRVGKTRDAHLRLRTDPHNVNHVYCPNACFHTHSPWVRFLELPPNSLGKQGVF